MFAKVERIHFVGIGGIGMSGIAKVLRNLGFKVTGSDMKLTDITRRLEGMGIEIFYDHKPENIRGASVVVFSSAISEENPEVIYAKSKGIPVIPRAEMLAELMRMKYSIAVSGSHGKTTASSIIGRVLERGGLDPTIVIGGIVKGAEMGSKLGLGDYLVAEADESDRSFLLLFPTLAVITSIDKEHLDCYPDLPSIKRAFLGFASRVPFYGAVIGCVDDDNVEEVLSNCHRRVITYGIEKNAYLKAWGINLNQNFSSFNVSWRDKTLGRVRLNLLGKHSIFNSLASIAVGIELGIDFPHIQAALEGFEGVNRRLEVKGESRGIIVIDDYGHHPTEVRTTLEALRLRFKKNRVVTLFQPHRYTRTFYLFREFGNAFKDTDILIITDVYPAGEKPIKGVTAQLIVDSVKSYNKPVEYIKGTEDIISYLLQILREGDVVLTLGAGNIWQIGEILLSKL